MRSVTNIKQSLSLKGSKSLFAMLPIIIFLGCADTSSLSVEENTGQIEYQLVESNPKDTSLYEVRDVLKRILVEFDIIRFRIERGRVSNPVYRPDTITFSTDLLHNIMCTDIEVITDFDSIALSFSFTTFIGAWTSKGLIPFRDWKQDFFQDIPAEQIHENSFQGIDIRMDSLKESKKIQYDELIDEANKYRFDSISSLGEVLSKYDSLEIKNKYKCYIGEFIYTFKIFKGNKMYRRVLRIRDPFDD